MGRDPRKRVSRFAQQGELGVTTEVDKLLVVPYPGPCAVGPATLGTSAPTSSLSFPACGPSPPPPGSGL